MTWNEGEIKNESRIVTLRDTNHHDDQHTSDDEEDCATDARGINRVGGGYKRNQEKKGIEFTAISNRRWCSYEMMGMRSEAKGSWWRSSSWRWFPFPPDAWCNLRMACIETKSTAIDGLLFSRLRSYICVFFLFSWSSSSFWFFFISSVPVNSIQFALGHDHHHPRRHDDERSPSDKNQVT